ncbi:hypothetical protein E2C01_056359 [Portunus trituberculatus]|uniref:Uncharacterized protein n=1 Tax=Portunus trituberculatus TaxID=210409 RepID=A0A5B7GYY1_PORTR|nr:hypothetical protein [Portunus trituberculatus]
MCRNEEEAERAKGREGGGGQQLVSQLGFIPQPTFGDCPWSGKVFASRGTSQGVRFAMRICAIRKVL